MDEYTKKTVPASALRFAIGAFELGDNGEGSKTAPFRMVARTGDSIEHWYWGKTVHDMAGMRAKSRIPIDYCHDEKEIVGFGNHINTDSGDLEVAGALTPYKDSDRASEIIFKRKAGVPYEASINFSSDDLVIEQLAEGDSAEVNGRQLTGPATIFRDWPLRGVAVCPYGYDANTSTNLNDAGDKTVAVKKITAAAISETIEELSGGDAAEAETKTTTDATEADTAVDEAGGDSAEVEADTELETAETVDADKELTDGEKFLNAFGDQGGVWFARGMSFEAAQEKFNEATRKALELLTAENEKLKQRLSASQTGEADVIGMSASELEDGKQSKPKGLVGNLRFGKTG